MKNKIKLPEVEPVVLDTILGVRAGLFILISAIAILLLLLFIIFVLPGLISDKAYVSFSLNAKHVAIYDGEKYLGSSEGSVYRVQSGEHEFSFKINGLDCGSVKTKLKKRIFFTLFHRSVDNIEYSIVNNNAIEKAEREYFLSNIAKVSRVIDYSSSYHAEPLFSIFAYNAVNLGFNDIQNLWLYGALHITSKELYEDYQGAKELLENSNIEYESEDLTKLESYLSKLYSDNTNETIKLLSKRNVEKPVKNNDFFTYNECNITLGKDVSLSYPEINQAPVNVLVPSFSISGVLISEYMYAEFVEENPYWAKSNKETLINNNLVDDNYLNGINLSTTIKSSRPIRNISYYSAQSYVEWLEKKTGIHYSLPTEEEWTVAALSASNKPYTNSLIGIDYDTSTPSNLLGQLWEYTETSYIPLARLIDHDKIISLSKEFDYDDIIIKGGSYINAKDNITVDSVGVVDKSTCSDYIGFRVVIHE